MLPLALLCESCVGLHSSLRSCGLPCGQLLLSPGCRRLQQVGRQSVAGKSVCSQSEGQANMVKHCCCECTVSEQAASLQTPGADLLLASLLPMARQSMGGSRLLYSGCQRRVLGSSARGGIGTLHAPGAPCDLGSPHTACTGGGCSCAVMSLSACSVLMSTPPSRACHYCWRNKARHTL